MRQNASKRVKTCQNTAEYFRRRMMRRRREQEQTDQGGLNISSLIDVKFLIFIYFFLTSTLDANEGNLQLTMSPTGGYSNQKGFDFDMPWLAFAAGGVVTMQKELIEKKTENSELVRLEDQVVTCLESRQPCGKESSPAAKLEGDGSAGGKRFIDVINCFAGVGTEDVRLVGFASK